LKVLNFTGTLKLRAANAALIGRLFKYKSFIQCAAADSAMITEFLIQFFITEAVFIFITEAVFKKSRSNGRYSHA
jgi:hypothetical protein